LAQYVYKLKQPTISMTFDSTTEQVGVSQDGEVTLDMDVFELRGAESVLREASWVENISIGVSLAFAKFSEQQIEELLGESVADKDVDGATKAGYTHMYIDGETYDSPDFEVKGILSSDDGTMEMGIRVPGIKFEGLTLGLAASGAQIPRLNGNGDNLHIHLPTTT